MRPRKKKHSEERLEAVNNYFIIRDENGLIDLNRSFINDKPLHVEIGCGKGGFTVSTAIKNPEINLLAVERIRDVIMIAMERASKAEVSNLKFLNYDVAGLHEILPEHCVDVLYINFCDPWPKKRNAKRRLTFHTFLENYKKFLKPDGEIHFKTDNRDLFDFSLEEFPLAGYKMKDITFDLHNSEYNENNIMTEYEKNFSEKGFKINRLVAYLPEKEEK